MKRRQSKPQSGLTFLDGDKLKRQMLRQGLTNSGLSDKTGLSRNTIISAIRGKGIYPSSACLIAEAMGIDDVTDLLPLRTEQEVVAPNDATRDTSEWNLAAYLGPWITASNGLQFRICRVQHRFVENRMGRGKWYDLLDPSMRTRENLQTQLLRHATICERIGLHPHIVENLSTYPGQGKDSWWVVDRWFESSTLDELLLASAFPREQLPRLMLEIALGLEALHKGNVIFRELSPSRVLIAATDGRAVLTDFELAKLPMLGPTVSSNWPDDPYRALEVHDGGETRSSDLYSWARILVHAASGYLPPRGNDLDALTLAGLPKDVWRVASDCLSPGPSGRPKTLTPVIKALRRWCSS